jgi:GNAT superfamily N-acetyltransferase
MIAVRPVEAHETHLVPSLCRLLVDAVHGGASVGFLAPVGPGTAERYWGGVLASLPEGLGLWIAEAGEEIVGAVQLSPCMKENGRHRAELQKLFVLRSHRGQGVASRLMAAAESFARSNGRTLLVLDTQAGSVAEIVYRRRGWERGGEIPDYAATPQGELHPTVYYYKRLAPE